MYRDKTILHISNKNKNRDIFNAALDNLFCLFPELLKSYHQEPWTTYDSILKKLWKREYNSVIKDTYLQFDTEADKIAFLLKWSK